MQSPLVVFIPEKERDALRSSGVIPASWYEMCGRTLWEGAGNRVYLWPHDADYKSATAGGGRPPPPAELLGLETRGDEWMRSENQVAKLFGSTILHVLFLDDEVQGSPGLVDAAPLIALSRWIRSLGDSICTWFAETQNRNIRHVAVVVARKGFFHLSDDQLRAIEGELTDSGALKTCYFVDSRLEVNLEHDALHAACLWPVIVGRLLLRVLIELNSENSSEGIFLPGVHLIRSFEYLMDCPSDKVAEVAQSAQQAVYRLIHLEGMEGESGTGNASRRLEVKNRENNGFAELKTRLSEYGGVPSPLSRRVDWHRVDVDNLVNMTNDDSLWNPARAKARVHFAECERKMFREKEKDRVMEARAVFGRVAKNPGNIDDEARRLHEQEPPDTWGRDIIYDKWRAMVHAELARKEAQKQLADAGHEMKRAQNHYVTVPYGMLAVVAASLFCGYALFRTFWALAGSDSLLVVLVLSSLSFVGAVGACLAMSWFHRRAGRMAMDELCAIKESVDAKMDDRHAASVEIVKTAEARHSVGLRRAAIAVLKRLLERVGRIVARELQSPTVDVSYRNGDANETEGAQTSTRDGDLRRDELEVFAAQTRFLHSVAGNATEIGGTRSSNVDQVIRGAFRESGEKSFKTFWSRLCAETDGLNQQGNFPAQVFVPRIRNWFKDFGDDLVMAQKIDLIENSRGNAAVSSSLSVLPKEFGDLRGDSGFALASAHVESDKVENSPRAVFLPSAAGFLADVRQLLGGAAGGEIEIRETNVLDGLPQVAFFFQDIRVWGIGTGEGGRLRFLSKQESRERNHREGEVA